MKSFEEFIVEIKIPSFGNFQVKLARFDFPQASMSMWVAAADLYAMCKLDCNQGKSSLWVQKRLCMWMRLSETEIDSHYWDTTEIYTQHTTHTNKVIAPHNATQQNATT